MSSESDLPDYTTVVQSHRPRLRPRRPITYTFTEWTSESILLVPPATSRDPRPLYQISVSLDLNPFLPVSYLTTVRRAGTNETEIVGRFEMSLNQKRAVLTVGDASVQISNVLTPIASSSLYQRHFDWSFEGINLRWDCRSVLDDGSPLCICYTTDSSMNQLASFVPPPVDAPLPLPAAVLTVFADGHDCFDDIILSALIIQRKMTATS